MAGPEPPAGGIDGPELLPARMLNEYAYCPRLFYLEHVQTEFADNQDTVEGRFRHRRVDVESTRTRIDANDASV